MSIVAVPATALFHVKRRGTTSPSLYVPWELVSDPPQFGLVPFQSQASRAVLLVATWYGPTKGPPPPTGGAPAGSIAVVEGSLIARSRLRRPLPVRSDVPAGSADSASRLTITPLL